jgi:hypothetical protein
MAALGIERAPLAFHESSRRLRIRPASTLAKIRLLLPVALFDDANYVS